MWQYMEMYVFTGSQAWVDSTGRTGKLPAVSPMGSPGAWASAHAPLNDLGNQGWELTAAVPTEAGYRLLLKRQKVAG